jgi:hypothetical protein
MLIIIKKSKLTIRFQSLRLAQETLFVLGLGLKGSLITLKESATRLNVMKPTHTVRVIKVKVAMQVMVSAQLSLVLLIMPKLNVKL